MPATDSSSSVFATTHWSNILAAKQSDTHAAEALQTLCQNYWYPLYAWVRREGHPPHTAQDLTQEFFASLLEKEWLQSVGPEKGRFRTFLLVAMKRFLINEWHKMAAAKRGGNITHVPLDSEEAERRFAAEPELAPDATYERRWAMTLLEQTLTALEEEFASSGKADDFHAMKACLTMDRGEISYADLAKQTGSNEGAMRVAVHRMRKHYRSLFREHIAATLADGEDVETEMRHVVSVLGSA
jgi:RNA polymerase sigma-70 factor (ECF subfamily)